ncbi:MAG TPA: tetratricopeptide repeat protein [Bacteroidia bacterium]|nr:tetratricopeptide repeat protein [Bacteroidia bacterium]
MKRNTSRKSAPVNSRPAVQKQDTKRLKIPFVPGLLAALLGFLLYSNTLQHGFALDDYSVILENRLTKQGTGAFPEIFTTSYRYGYYFTDDDLYRPLPKALFALEWALAPGNPAPGHWLNVLLFAFTGFILFRLLYRFTKGNQILSLFASSLFMAHPIHTEVVANIKSSDELLALFFCITALVLFIKGSDRKGSGGNLISALIYFLALMSKESSITFIAVFPLTAWFFSDTENWKSLKNYLPIVVVTALFLLIRSSVLKGIEPGMVSIADNLLAGAQNYSQKFATAVLILGLYFKLLIFPQPLAFDYSYNQIPLTGISDPGFIISALVYVSILVVSVRLLPKKHFLAYCGLFFLITLSVYSNLFITIGSSMGERFLYMPSLGFCLALGWVLCKFADSKHPLIGKWDFSNSIYKTPGFIVMLCFVTGYSFKTITRNPVWKNNGTLYENDVHISENSTRTHYYLGNYLVKPEAWEGKSKEGRDSVLRRGISELQKSIAIYPGFADAHLQMGVAYDKLEMPDSALFCYNEALKLNPGNATIYNNIGTVFFKKGDYAQALEYFRNAISHDSRYAEAYANAGSAFGMMQQYDDALSALFNAVKWDPGYAQAYYYIGLTYRFKGDEQNAKAYLAKAAALDPAYKQN